MSYSIITNVGNLKKPWMDVPIEVLIEEERKKERLKEHREHLYAPSPMPKSPPDLDVEKEDEYKIVIKL